MSQTPRSSTIPAVNGYMEPVISAKKKTVTVFTVGGKHFLEEESAEDWLKKMKKAHRDNVRDVARSMGVEQVHHLLKNDASKWLMENYALEDFENLELAHILKKDSSAGFHSKGFDSSYAIVVDEIPDFDLMNTTDRTFHKMRKKNLLYETVKYRTAELVYHRALECAEVDDSGEVVSVLPMQMAANLIDPDLVMNEVRDFLEVLSEDEEGSRLDAKRIKGVVHYWIVGDEKNLNPFKKF